MIPIKQSRTAAFRDRRRTGVEKRDKMKKSKRSMMMIMCCELKRITMSVLGP